MSHDLNQIVERLEDLEWKFVARFDAVDIRQESLRYELMASIRGEMISQTRTIIFALVGTVVSLVALVFAVIGIS